MIFDLRKEVYYLVKNIKWNFKGIIDTDNKIHPIPKNLNFQALFERLVFEKLNYLAKKYKIKVVDPNNIRAYPDVILEGGVLGKKVIAVDIKTGRRKGDHTGLTLGSYAGYFRKPDKKCAGCARKYNDFSEHWVVCFVYDWNPNNNSLNMISNIKVIVHEKWKIASKRTGTGTTTAIGSIRDIDKITKGEGDFKTEKEFLQYWRNYLPRNKK